MRVLIVEDNPKLSAGLSRGLREHGFAVDTANDGFDGEELAWTEPYDLIVLDLMLPGQDGIQICRNLRRRKVGVPVLMLTSLSDVEEKVKALDAGADDYVTKPFAFDELLARVRALVRRGRSATDRNLTFSDLTLDVDRRVAVRAGQPVSLSSREFGLLYHLMQNAEKVLSRTQIIEKVWDMNYEPESNIVDVYIGALRKKIDKGYEPKLIHTVIGQGYRLGLPIDDGTTTQEDIDEDDGHDAGSDAGAMRAASTGSHR